MLEKLIVVTSFKLRDTPIQNFKIIFSDTAYGVLEKIDFKRGKCGDLQSLNADDTGAKHFPPEELRNS
ncbi:hypothetical protein RIR_jg17827.t1 [Rhizophagus irregularis DAOM 181602=DAOM 197198]|nr:hypothetical protein RIR_jg17827.t1 [Rhizophagus irregularis DAOM 181602=DAOM 197198]